MGDKKTKILVYHHYDNLLFLLKTILELKGYTNCLVTNNIQELLHLSVDFSPQVVLMDLKTSAVNKFEVLRKLYTERKDGMSIIVICSEGERNGALKFGAKGFIPISFSISDVLNEVEKVLMNN